MDFKLIESGGIRGYLSGRNPIPFSTEFQKFCEIRYGAKGLFVGALVNGQLEWILSLAVYQLDHVTVAEVPNATYYTEPILINPNTDFDLERIGTALLRFLKVDVIKFNIVDYQRRLSNKNYPVRFLALDLDATGYESAEDVLQRKVILRRRNQIRFAYKQELAVSLTGQEGLDGFYQLYRKHHQERHFSVRSMEELKNLMAAFGEKAKILTVRHQSEIVSGIIFVIDQPALWMVINASDYAFSHLQANNYAYWEVIRFGLAHGVKRFDFGGTPVHDVGNIQFKKGFGVSLHEIYSPIYFRTSLLRTRYWLQRKTWHLKLRWRIVRDRLKMNLGF